MDMLKQNSKYIGYGGCALAALGTFLPLVTSSALGVSVAYISGDGKILLVLAVVAAVLMYLKKDMYSLIPSAICALLLLIVATKGASFGLAYGFFVMLLGVAGMIAGPLLGRK